MTKNESRTIVLLLAGILWAGFAQAQDSVNSGGGDAIGSGGSVAYSIGQVAYTTNTEASGCMAQGVQHAYEIFTVSINETASNISLKAFPNPTSEILILEISDYNIQRLFYQLFDIQGKLLINSLIEAPQTQMSLDSLPNATYFVHVVNLESQIIQSFKIIKQ